MPAFDPDKIALANGAFELPSRTPGCEALGALLAELPGVEVLSLSDATLSKSAEEVVIRGTLASASLPIALAGQRVALILRPEFGGSPATVSLSTSLARPLELADGLQGIATLLGGQEVALPDGFPRGLGFSLHDLSFTLGAGGVQAFSAVVRLGEDDGWRAVPGLFTFYQTELGLWWQRGKRGGLWSFAISGAMNVLGYDLLLGYRHPAGIFTATLAPGAYTSRKLAELLRGLGLPSELAQGVGPALTVADLSLYYDRKSEELELRIANAEEWQIAKGLDIDKVELRLAFERRQFSSAELTARLGLPIGPTNGGRRAEVSVFLDARYDRGEKRWSFEGETGPGQPIAVGDALAALATRLGAGSHSLPDALHKLTLENLLVRFDSGGSFASSLIATLPLGEASARVRIDLLRQQGGAWQLAGALALGGHEFKIDLRAGGQTSSLLVASWTNARNQPLRIAELVASLSADLGALVPDSLQVTPRSAFFAVHSSQGVKRFVLGLSVGAKVDLRDLPLVGSAFPPGQTVGLDSLQLVVASSPLDVTQVTEIGALLPPGFTLPPQPLGKGPNLAASFQLGAQLAHLALPVLPRPTAGSPAPLPPGGAVPAQPPPDGAQWLPVQQRLGPVYFERFGVQYREERLKILLDAALTVAGLTLSVDGLSIATPLDAFSPRFDIRGIGVEYKGGAVEIGGALVRTGDDAFAGAAVLKTKAFMLSAIGAYASVEGRPSLFVYAVLDRPIGGPAFFFVEGLSAGFGYNRAFFLPTLDEVERFPLVRAALQPPPVPTGDAGSAALVRQIGEIQRGLQRYIPPAVGQHFLALGIKFSSFRIIDSVAVLVMKLGERFEIDLLGLSQMVAPPPKLGADVTPLAVVKIGLVGRFRPEEGTLQIDGKVLDGSYVLSRDCRLSGGFAFYCWFSGEHAGDFVFTVGGYHSLFRPPPHYPRVPRLALNWPISRELSIKGEVYFALTSRALMAGGRLDAVYQSGSLRAWFIAGADFLIAWQPYMYDARLYVRIGASFKLRLLFFTVKLTVEIGADLHIWGPEFGGTARVDCRVFSFTISFGSRAPTLPKVDWRTFRSTFLPAPEEMCSIQVTSGLLRTIAEGGHERWVLSPTSFGLAVNLAIPSKEGPGTSTPAFGIAPMEVAAGRLRTSTRLRITKEGESVEGEFALRPIRKNVPVAMWGQSRSPSLEGEGFIADAVAGYVIGPLTPPQPGMSQAIDVARLSFDLENGGRFEWRSFSEFLVAGNRTNQAVVQELSAPEVAARRLDLLSALGFAKSDVDLRAMASNPEGAFLIAPQLKEAA